MQYPIDIWISSSTQFCFRYLHSSLQYIQIPEFNCILKPSVRGIKMCVFLSSLQDPFYIKNKPNETAKRMPSLT